MSNPKGYDRPRGTVICNPRQLAPALTLHARVKIPAAVIISNTKYLRAEKLAPKVKEIHTGIYRVGLSTVSIWHASCTCQARRENQKTPCAHQIALWLSDHVQTWGAEGLWLMRHNLKYSDSQPRLIATYAKVKADKKDRFFQRAKPFKGGFYRIINFHKYPVNDSHTSGKTSYCLVGKNGQQFYTWQEQLHTLTPFYAESAE